MRFETSQSTPPQLNHRLQQRMLSFVVMLAVVMFLVNVLLTDPPAKSNDVARRSAVSHRDFDPEIRDDGPQSLKPGEFITPPDEFQPPIKRFEGQAASDESGPEDPVARDREASLRNTRFDKRVLVRVKDNTLGIRREEAEAYYRLLDHVRHVSKVDLERAAVPEVQYINLLTDPDRFRGEPVTIQGDLWRLYEFAAGSNDRGLTTLYEAWIFTGDSSSRPYRVVSTSLPHTLTPGENVRRPVRVTGYFFKQEGYPSQGGVHVAPTLLAPTITPVRLANSIPPFDQFLPNMISVVTAIGLALLVTLLALTFGDRRVKRIARHRLLNEPPPSFVGLDAGPLITVEESLRQFAEQKRQVHLSQEIAASGQDAGTVATSVLYRRDPEARVTARVPAVVPSEDELQARQIHQANVLQDWTARRKSLADEVADSQDVAQRGREQVETERVLNRLDPATVTDAENSDAAMDQLTVRAQLERDRLDRERELSDRLREQRIQMEQERLEQLEREQAALAQAQSEAARAQAEQDRERHATEMRPSDESDRLVTPSERLIFDRAAREGQSFEDELYDESDLAHDYEAPDLTEAEDATGEADRPAKPAGWVRNNPRSHRRRDRHRRDGR